MTGPAGSRWTKSAGTEADIVALGSDQVDAAWRGRVVDLVRRTRSHPDIRHAPREDAEQAAAFAAATGARWAELAGADSAPALLRELL